MTHRQPTQCDQLCTCGCHYSPMLHMRPCCGPGSHYEDKRPPETMNEFIYVQLCRDTVRIPTAQGTAVISQLDAQRLLRGWQLVKTFEGWRVKR